MGIRRGMLCVFSVLTAACPGRRTNSPDAGIATDAPGDAAVSDRPRPLAPLCTATVRTARPSLRVASDALNSVHVDVCADRTCARVEQAGLPVIAGRAVPSGDLAAGLHFWRVRGGDRVGPTWWFRVPVRSPGRDTAWGTVPDVNGDGLADVLVGATTAGANEQGRVYVFRGRPGALPTTADARFEGTESAGHFGWSVGSAGDVDGDGFSDVLVGAPDERGYAGRAYVFPGGENGLGTAGPRVLVAPATGGSFGAAAAAVGDVDRDGYGDVAVGAPAAGGVGELYVYRGGASGLGEAPWLTLRGDDGPGGMFGASVADAGDLDGDSYGDLVVGASGVRSGDGKVYVFMGGPDGLVERGPVVDGPTGVGSRFGEFVAGAGDVNGDGYAEMLVGASAADGGYAHVVFGGPRGSALARVVRTGPDGRIGEFGWSVTGLGDVNGDGYDDVSASAVCAPFGALVPDAGYFECGPGRVYVYYGEAAGIPGAASVVLAGREIEEAFGWSVAGTGDLDGDGFGDMAIGAFRAGADTGRVLMVRGSANGLQTAGAGALAGQAAGERFGWGVARGR